MTRPFVLPGTKRGRGSPNWGKAIPVLPVMVTQFELQVERLGLSKALYIASPQLKRWCELNRNRCYAPEWLFKAWEIEVEAIFYRSCVVTDKGTRLAASNGSHH
jgi:hypothetical protein